MAIKKNHVNADSDNNSGKNLTLKASIADAFPHCAKNRLIFSIVDILSCPKNFENSVILYRLGCGTLSKLSRYGCRYIIPLFLGLSPNCSLITSAIISAHS